MKNTKQELKEAILTLANSIQQKPNYIAIIDCGTGLSRVVEMIAYELFLNVFDSRSCSDELYNAYQMVHDYACELKQHGEVNFK